MRKPTKRVLFALGVLAVIGVVAPVGLWLSFTHQPSFYQDLVEEPTVDREEEAKRFVAQSLQLRNDIVNEPSWEALFSDHEVNAWLAEDLVKHFADQLPPEVHDPRVVFENDRITLAFRLDQGQMQTVVWIVGKVWVPEDNVLSIALEKVRAGALPFPPEKFVEQLTNQAKKRGLDLTWTHQDGNPVATIKYQTQRDRMDVVLERIQIIKGQIKLNGRSMRDRGPLATPGLPDGRVLQLNFPRRNTQSAGDFNPVPPATILRSEAGPAS